MASKWAKIRIGGLENDKTLISIAMSSSIYIFSSNLKYNGKNESNKRKSRLQVISSIFVSIQSPDPRFIFVNKFELFPSNCLWGALLDQRDSEVLQRKIIRVTRLSMHG